MISKLRPSAVALAVSAVLCLSACGGINDDSTDSSGQPSETVVLTDSYRIEYVPGAAPAAQGRTEFTIKVSRRSDGAAVPGLSLELSPVMHMSAHSHSTPIDGEPMDNGDGSYSCALYYLMASEMNGVSMGAWELTVIVDDGTGGEADEVESAVFELSVGMPMGGDAVRSTLKGQADLVAAMSGGEKRTYHVFSDGLTGLDSFNVFIAVKESMMSYPALSVGGALHDENGEEWTVDDLSVEASADGQLWAPGVDLGGGHWSFSGLEGLEAGVEGSVQVRLSVNAEVKTTDGGLETESNDRAVFTVLPEG